MFPNYAGSTQSFPNYGTGQVGTVAPSSYVIPPQAFGTSMAGQPGMMGPPGAYMGGMGQPGMPPGGGQETVIGGSSPMESVCNDCGDTCNSCVPCAAPYCPWFGGAAALFMGRDRANKFWTSADGNTPANQLMNTNDIGNQYQPGGEVRLGRYIGQPAYGIGGAALGGFGGGGAGLGGYGMGGAGCGCGGYAIEGVYWALTPINGYASVNAPSANDGLVTPIILDAPPVPTIGPYNASDYFDGALKHELWRRDYLQNIELNFWRLPLFNPTSRCQVNWMAGVRYLRFTDDLVFGAVSGSQTIPQINGTEAYLDTKMVNNLIGVQTGARGNYFLTRTVSLYAQPVVGRVRQPCHQQHALVQCGGGSGLQLGGKLNDVALLGQLDLGTQWFLSPRWSVFVAYRVIGLSGVGLSDNQIPIYLNDQPAIRDVHSNGSLIVSGGVFGTWFSY